MTTVQQLIQLLLLLVTLTQAKPGPAQAKPGPSQAKPGPDQVCCTVVGTNRWNISTIYYTHKEDQNLYERVPLNTPLLNCTNTPVDLDTCRVCVLTERAEEQVVVVCLLTEPEAELLFEGGGQTLTTSHSACPAPPPPPPPLPPPPPPDLGLMIALPLGLLLLLLVLLLVLVGYFREKIKSCLKCRCQKFCKEGRRTGQRRPPNELTIDWITPTNQQLIRLQRPLLDSQGQTETTAPSAEKVIGCRLPSLQDLQAGGHSPQAGGHSPQAGGHSPQAGPEPPSTRTASFCRWTHEHF